MHELSIAESILDAVRVELLRYPGAKPMRVGLKIGAFTAVDVESLNFCFESVVRGTEWENLRLEAHACRAMRRCEACEADFESVEYNVVCPVCCSHTTISLGGDELDFEYLEVETDGATPTQIESTE